MYEIVIILISRKMIKDGVSILRVHSNVQIDSPSCPNYFGTLRRTSLRHCTIECELSNYNIYFNLFLKATIRHNLFSIANITGYNLTDAQSLLPLLLWFGWRTIVLSMELSTLLPRLHVTKSDATLDTTHLCLVLLS